MQFTITILALATAALAAPSISKRDECTFGQYACSPDGLSIQQCDITGNWVYIGACPDGDYCGYDGTNDLPYCYGPNKAKRAAPPYCANPGTYSCTGDAKGIDVCNSQHQLVFNGACPPNTHCALLPSANNLPFCISN